MKFQGKEFPLIVTLLVLGVACIVLLILTITFAHQNDMHDEETVAPVCIQDFEDYAQKTMDTNKWLYISTGATTQTTMRANKEAYQHYRFRPKLLMDVSKVDTWVQVLNRTVAMPIGFAPSSYQTWMSPDGDRKAARAADNTHAPMIFSAYATTRMEEVLEGMVNVQPWQQTYLFNQRDVTLDFVRRMEKTKKIQAVVVTVDKPWPGINYESLRGNRKSPADISKYVNFPGIPRPDLKNSAQTWDYVKWLVSQTKLPVILKGVLTARDAVKAAECGVSGVIVSNHGGRILDGGPATLDALGEVVAALNGTQLEVYLDGGVRTGMDVVKAMILGARAVFVGRPLLWGLHHSGQEGVEKVLDIFLNEFKNTLKLIGAPSPLDLTPDMLIKADSSTDVARKRMEL